MLSHLTTDGPPADAVARTVEVYQGATSPIVFRTRHQIAQLFGGADSRSSGPASFAPGNGSPSQPTPCTPSGSTRESQRSHEAVARSPHTQPGRVMGNGCDRINGCAAMRQG